MSSKRSRSSSPASSSKYGNYAASTFPRASTAKEVQAELSYPPSEGFTVEEEGDISSIKRKKVKKPAVQKKKDEKRNSSSSRGTSGEKAASSKYASTSVKSKSRKSDSTTPQPLPPKVETEGEAFNNNVNATEQAENVSNNNQSETGQREEATGEGAEKNENDLKKSCPLENRPAPLFSYGNEDPIGAPAVFFDLATLANNNNCSSNCHWWKSRSVACAKCQVQPLAIRPKPEGGGYGPKLKGKDGDYKRIKDANKSRLIPKDAEEFMKGDGAGKNDRNGTRGSGSKYSGRSTRCSRVKTRFISETQASYGPPCLGKQAKRNKLKERAEQTLWEMKRFMGLRPPWNNNTSIPPPPQVETLSAAESKVKELETLSTAHQSDRSGASTHVSGNTARGHTNPKPKTVNTPTTIAPPMTPPPPPEVTTSSKPMSTSSKAISASSKTQSALTNTQNASSKPIDPTPKEMYIPPKEMYTPPPMQVTTPTPKTADTTPPLLAPTPATSASKAVPPAPTPTPVKPKKEDDHSDDDDDDESDDEDD